jgi:hypothetical protein
MLLFGGVLLTCLAPFVSIEFLGSSLTFMMVYVWGRRHQYVNLSFLGIFNFTAPYLPWVLLAFSVMLGSSPKVDLLGMVAGWHHSYSRTPAATALWPWQCHGAVQQLNRGNLRKGHTCTCALKAGAQQSAFQSTAG